MDGISSLSGASIGAQSYDSIKAEAEVNGFSDTLNKAIEDQDDEKLRESCNEFEAYFIQSLYKQMLKTVDDSNSLFPKSQATETFNDFLIEEYAKNITEAGGLGLSDMMYDSIQVRQQALEDPINQ